MAMLEFGTSRMVEEADLSSAGTVVGVGSSVNALAWSRESSLAAGCGDGTVLHVDLRREDVRELPATSPVRALSWCPGGELLAAGYDDGDARVWIVDAASAVLVGEQPRAHAVRAVAWSPGRQRLAVASGARIEVWAMPCNERLLDFAAHDAEVTALAWSPDGATLASASRDHTVALWERDGRSMVRHAVLPGHDGPAYALAWSPAGSTLATGGGDHVVRMWDAATGDQRTVLDGHDAWIDALAWSPTEPHLLASGGGDRRVQVWDVERGDQLAAFDGHESTVLALAWSPDGATLASGSDDETIQFWTCW